MPISKREKPNFLPNKNYSYYDETLDVVLTNIEQCSITGGITEQVEFSDHAAVFCSILRPETATRQPDNLESSVVVRSWPNGGQANATTQMEEALARHMSTLLSSGIIPMWNEWKTKYIAALDEVAPQCAVRKIKRDRRCPWMTQELLHLLHQQKSLFKKIKKTKKPCVEWRAQHRQLRNNYSTLYRQLRNEHFQTTIGSSRHNPQALWKTINHVMGRRAHHLPPALSLSVLEIILAASSTNLIPSATCHLVLCPRSDSLNFNL